MYRALAWKALHDGVDLADEAAVAALGERATFDVEGGRIGIDGHDVTAAIRTPEMDKASATLARHPAVRRVLVARQRAYGEGGGVVMEGRDIGTVVFPDADVKIYLDASPEERARRRAADPAHTSSKTRAAVRGRDGARRTRQSDSTRAVVTARGRAPTPSSSTRPACRSNGWSSGYWCWSNGSGRLSSRPYTETPIPDPRSPIPDLRLILVVVLVVFG